MIYEIEMEESMKILAPLRSFDQLDVFIKAGANEFYFGFDDDEWNKKFGSIIDLNRMSAMKEKANKFLKSDVPIVINHIHRRGCQCFLVLNGNVYSKEQIEYLEQFLLSLEEKPDGIIFSDLQLIKGIINAGMQPVASTMCAIYNNDILSVYKALGVKRFILPRELTLQEINQLIRLNSDIQIEAFLMRNGCMFSDSNCLGVHRGFFGGVCGFIRNSDYQLISNEPIEKLQYYHYRHFLYNEAMLSNACGLCAIYRLIKMDVYAVKIVGRADRTEEILKDIKATHKNIEIALKSKSEKEFLNKMYLPNRWKMVCGMSCYYPEILSNNIL